MKKSILFLASLLVFATSCYEDYVRDNDHTAAFIAYQYDLRTFVLGEGEQFKVTVALAGTMQNDKDRNVQLALEPSLLDGALASLIKTDKTSAAYVAQEMAAEASVFFFSICEFISVTCHIDVFRAELHKRCYAFEQFILGYTSEWRYYLD